MNTLRLPLVAFVGLALVAGAALAGENCGSACAGAAAVAVKRVQPDFPVGTAARTGRAQVLVEIDAQGRVVSAKVESATNAEFAAAALAAARSWEFKPAQKDGRAVATWARLPFKFEATAVAVR